ncbi:MAG: RdgB/HAM1 family non-canonical purine NTP pyrophosphatase [Gammaproteobacteria bacterium]|nr:RdgB/HAM1 family non-canonical purine NTP pyrophosphatase [Gammaproteobacteria bacterium]
MSKDEHQMKQQTVVLASGNEKKLRELKALLPVSIDLISQGMLGIESPPEIGLSFVENALIKARYASLQSGLPAIADDSGLEVSALGGAPGIRSARYASETASDSENISHLLQEMAGITNRSARFVSVMVYLRHASDPVPLIAQGFWEGSLLTEPVGREGFGYDPIFLVNSRNCSAASLTAEEKNQISHRNQAAKRLCQQISTLAPQSGTPGLPGNSD